MKIISMMLFAMVVYCASLAQTKTTGTAKSAGPCSPAVTGDNNTFHFEYCGVDPEEGKRMIRLLNAAAQGQALTNNKLDQILEILLKPAKITMLPVSVATPTGGHPRAAINFYTDDPVDRGQFEVECDHACMPVDICTLPGSNASKLATLSDRVDVVEFLFQRQFPALTLCQLTVESRDDKAVNIKNIRTSTRAANLVWNAIQPMPRTWSGGTLIQ